MTNLLVMKEYLKQFYAKYEVYLHPLTKFLLSLISLGMINSKLGYMGTINHVSIVLIVALMCSFLPRTCIILFDALFILLHLYAMALECAVVALALFLVLFLLYFRFSPKSIIAVVITPICFGLKIPYLVPVAYGLASTPASAVAVGCGVVAYYLISYMSGNAAAVSGMAADEMVTRFRFVIDGLIGNKAMLLTIVAFSITIMVVYIVRRLPIVQSWRIAILAGVLTDIMVMLIGDLMLDTNLSISILGLLGGSIVAALVGEVLRFLLFNVDYYRMERVQFEDDEYYYYVKAVPKITIAKPSKNVKKINSQRRPQHQSSQNK